MPSLMPVGVEINFSQVGLPRLRGEAGSKWSRVAASWRRRCDANEPAPRL